MRVFVTGATGFIGSHLTAILLKAGCQVAILALPDDPLVRIAALRDQIEVIEGNLHNIERWQATLARFNPDACISLAWYAEPGKYLYSQQNTLVFMSSIRLLQVLIEMECRQVVMVGTCAEYDTEVGYLREDSPTQPTTIYAATKLALSIIGQQMALDAGIRFAWARLFFLYGEGEDDRRVVPALIKALLQDSPFPATAGEQVRDYLHVRDVAAALWFIAQHQLSGIFNISSGIPVTMHSLMEIIGDLMDRKDLIQFGTVPYREWDPMFICGDNSKLRKAGWEKQYTLRDGLAQTIAWWRMHLASSE